MKISVITPSFNCKATIETAILSVTAQGYPDFEHIIVDGGSTDGALDILKAYPHLRWVSETDRGQVHAMNKGFAMATGQIVGYLNADDYYVDGAFSSVVSRFQKGAKIVMGKVRVRSEKPEGIREWICDPKTRFDAILRHWEPDAFCVNPVGYFYLREVQEAVPLNEKTGDKHDLEFLMEAALRFPITKIDTVLGVFNHSLETQTGQKQLRPSYWDPNNFSFVDRLAEHLPVEEKYQFRLARDIGYQIRREWTVKEALDRDMAKTLIEEKELFFLPASVEKCAETRCAFVEHDRMATRGDWVIPIVDPGGAGGRCIRQILDQVQRQVFPVCRYFFDLQAPEHEENSRDAVACALERLLLSPDIPLCWKIIIGLRDPLESALCIHDTWPLSDEADAGRMKARIRKWLSKFDGFFDRLFDRLRKASGEDSFIGPLDLGDGYRTFGRGRVQVLLYRFHDLPRILSPMLRTFLGIENAGRVSMARCSTFKVEGTPRIGFDSGFLQEVYSSPIVERMFTKMEIEAFQRKWSGPQSL